MSRIKKPKIVDGGTSIYLGNNLHLLKGRTHEDGGIDIGSNPSTGIEAENNEVVQIGNDFKVFSAQPILNGESPANKVINGENPSKVFKSQEDFKDINGINDDGTKNNKSMKRKKAALGTQDYLNIGSGLTNILGSIGSYSIQQNALDNLEEPTRPTRVQPAKLKTDINITPQLEQLDRIVNDYTKSVYNNTADSRVALARQRSINSDTIGAKNTLYADKENKETALINQDKLNTQGVEAANIAAYNTYLSNLADHRNAIKTTSSSTGVDLVSNVTSAMQNVADRYMKGVSDKNTADVMYETTPNATKNYYDEFDAAGFAKFGGKYKTKIKK